MFSLWKRHGIYFRNLYLENTSAERIYWPPQGFWWKQPILGIGRQSVNSGRLCQFGCTVSIRVKCVNSGEVGVWCCNTQSNYQLDLG